MASVEPKKSIQYYFSPESKQKKHSTTENGTKDRLMRKPGGGKPDTLKQKVARKSLHTIQRSSQREGLARPGDGIGQKSGKPQGFHVYEDDPAAEASDVKKPVAAKETEDVGVQCQAAEGACGCSCHGPTQETAEEEAYRLMVQEDVPEDYWKQLAEQRQQALNDTLEENQMLHEEMEQLKEQNQSLSELAGQAEYFASILKEVVDSKDDVSSASTDGSSSASESRSDSESSSSSSHHSDDSLSANDKA